MQRRGSGILLHITSLPSRYGIGDLGPGARTFAAFLVKARQRYWQILPLNPTETVYGNSPYSSTSAFAGNPLLISPQGLVDDGLLRKKDIAHPPSFPKNRVDYPAVIAYKRSLFDLALERFEEQMDDTGLKTPRSRLLKISDPQGKRLDIVRALTPHQAASNALATGFDRFCIENVEWLEDFALFVALKDHFQGQSWDRWPRAVRDRHPKTLNKMTCLLADRLQREKVLQFLFFRQWRALKSACNRQTIKIIGDLPLYVAFDSADVWSHPELFKLNRNRRPRVVSGSPPDAFFESGQIWGTPVYQWDRLKETGYDWWRRRLACALKHHDLIRLDHFRGFTGFWEIPAGKAAKQGRWVAGPGEDFFKVLAKKFPGRPFIAEDLGTITDEIRVLMKRFGIPGLSPLIAAFSGDPAVSDAAPHAVGRDCVVLTGTHDFNTVRGWFEDDATPANREQLFRYLGRRIPAGEVPCELIRLAMMTVADTAIFPMQDLLGLGGAARMNHPGTARGNWEWRLESGGPSASQAEKLGRMTALYGRT